MFGALIMALLGNAMQKEEKEAAYGRGQRERRQGRERSREVEQEQREGVLSTAQSFAPAARQEETEANMSEAEQQIMAALSDNPVDTTGDTGVISDRLLEQRAASTRDRANSASVLASLLSKVQAPGNTARDEQGRMRKLGAESRGRSSELGRIGRTSEALAGMRGRTDPSAVMNAALMQQLGLSAASGSILEGLQPPGAGGANTVRSATPTFNI